MKPKNKIQENLVIELYKNLNKIKFEQNIYYYNEILGDTSFLLAGLLEALLKSKFYDWDQKKWFDDSLLTKVKLNEDKLSIEGIMIWGIENTTEQWTEPFYFEIKLYQDTFIEYTFLFGALNKPEISYDTFKQNRDYWDKQFYINNDGDISKRNWKYTVSSTNNEQC